MKNLHACGCLRLLRNMCVFYGNAYKPVRALLSARGFALGFCLSLLLPFSSVQAVTGGSYSAARDTLTAYSSLPSYSGGSLYWASGFVGVNNNRAMHASVQSDKLYFWGSDNFFTFPERNDYIYRDFYVDGSYSTVWMSYNVDLNNVSDVIGKGLRMDLIDVSSGSTLYSKRYANHNTDRYDVINITAYKGKTLRMRFLIDEGSSSAWMGISNVSLSDFRIIAESTPIAWVADNTNVGSCVGAFDTGLSSHGDCPGGAVGGGCYLLVGDRDAGISFQSDSSTVSGIGSRVLATPRACFADIAGSWGCAGSMTTGYGDCDGLGKCTASGTGVDQIDLLAGFGVKSLTSEVFGGDPVLANFKQTSSVVDYAGGLGLLGLNLSFESAPGQLLNEYRQIYISGVGASLTFAPHPSNEYRIKQIRMLSLTTLYLPPGDYWVEELNMDTDSSIKVAPGTQGTVRLFVWKGASGQTLKLQSGVTFNNGGAADRFAVYGFSDIWMIRHPSGDPVITGAVYARQTILMDPGVATRGSMTAGLIHLEGSAEHTYDASSLNVDFGEMCAGVVVPVNHYRISHSGSGVNCQPEPIVVSAHRASGSAYIGNTGTITLSTSTGHGDWVSADGAGILDNGVADDGIATYTYAGSEASGEVTFGLQNTHEEVVNINISDGSASEWAASDADIVYSAEGIVLLYGGAAVGFGDQIAGKASNVGFSPASLGLRVVATDPATGACTDRLPAGVNSIQFAFECNQPSSCVAGSLMNIADAVDGANNVNLFGHADGTALASLTYQGVDLTMDAAASGHFVLNYPDAGEVTLHLKLALAADASGPALNVSKSSNPFVVRPFGLGFGPITDASNNPNPGAPPAPGGAFVTAGESFRYTLGGYLYNASHDMNNDGLADAGVDITGNGLAPNFKASVDFSVASFLPAGGDAGALGLANESISSGGKVSINNQSWSEVGSLVIQAKVEDYLGSGSITSLSQSIGKIYPKEIKATALSSPLQIYMDEPFDLGMTIQALGQAGNVLLNYDATMYPVDAISLHAENNDDGNDLSARLSGLAGTWVKGVFQSAAGDSNFADIEFSRPTVANLAASGGPYNNLSLGVSVAAGAEAGVIVGDVAADMNAAAAGCGGGCDAVTIKSGARINYARLAAMPSQGAENKSLDIPLVLEVWDGTHFVRNMSDNTTLVSDAVTGAPTFSNYTENLSAGELLLSQVPAAGLSFTAGAVPPGAGYRVDNTVGLGNWGSVTATFGGTTVVDWLRFDWDGNAATADTGPSSTHTYGNYRGSDKVIHWQER